MVPTFSFGCGTAGGNSTTDNVNIYHYLNIKRVARRTPAHMGLTIILLAPIMDPEGLGRLVATELKLKGADRILSKSA